MKECSQTSSMAVKLCLRRFPLVCGTRWLWRAVPGKGQEGGGWPSVLLLHHGGVQFGKIYRRLY